MSQGNRSKKVKWGVLGVASIAVRKVIPGMQHGEWSEVAAIASRDPKKAQAAASSLKIAKAYGSYEELLADVEIEAIYNPLPNHLHVPWSIKAAEARKHTLCEKPIALNALEARTLLAVRDRMGVKIGEAFMVKTHPQWLRTRELIREGRIGELRAIVGAFSYFNRDPQNVRHKPEWGGGGLLDIGSYPITMSRFMFGAEPLRVSGVLERDPDFGTDRLASEIEIPFNSPIDKPTRLFVDDGSDLSGAGIKTEMIPACDQYTIQGDAFSRAIRENTDVPVPLEDAIANMAVIDAVFRSAETGEWEKPKF